MLYQVRVCTCEIVDDHARKAMDGKDHWWRVEEYAYHVLPVVLWSFDPLPMFHARGQPNNFFPL